MELLSTQKIRTSNVGTAARRGIAEPTATSTLVVNLEGEGKAKAVEVDAVEDRQESQAKAYPREPLYAGNSKMLKPSWLWLLGARMKTLKVLDSAARKLSSQVAC